MRYENSQPGAFNLTQGRTEPYGLIGATCMGYFGPQGGRLEFPEHTRADPAALISLIQRRSQDFTLDGPQRLRILMARERDTERFLESRQLLEQFIPED